MQDELLPLVVNEVTATSDSNLFWLCPPFIISKPASIEAKCTELIVASRLMCMRSRPAD